MGTLSLAAATVAAAAVGVAAAAATSAITSPAAVVMAPARQVIQHVAPPQRPVPDTCWQGGVRGQTVISGGDAKLVDPSFK